MMDNDTEIFNNVTAGYRFEWSDIPFNVIQEQNLAIYYELKEQIGQGSCGKIYRAYLNNSNSTEYAIKEIDISTLRKRYDIEFLVEEINYQK